MAEKYENLTVIHFHVDTFHSPEATTECLLKILNSEEFASSFKSLADNRRSFIVVGWHLSDLKLVIITFDKSFLAICVDLFLTTAARRPATSVVRGRAQEARPKALTKVRRNDLVQIEAKERKDEEVDEEHPKGGIERVILVHNGGS